MGAPRRRFRILVILAGCALLVPLLPAAAAQALEPVRARS
jgi:hypothetical protein